MMMVSVTLPFSQTMPGLSTRPGFFNQDLTDDNRIIGLS